jgi:hypothetical protein
MDPDGGDREDGEAKSYPDCYYRAYRNLSLIARNYTLPSGMFCPASPIYASFLNLWVHISRGSTVSTQNYGIYNYN